MSESVELKNCPLCGSSVVYETMKVRKGYEAVIACNGCPVYLHTITHESEDDALKEAITCWNRRV